jgi:hypothetical protein
VVKNTQQIFGSELVQLSIPFHTKPFLEFKKKVRGRNRLPFDKIQEGALELKDALHNGEIQSLEAKLAIRDFLKKLGVS